jgi:hypothetical protein
MQSTVTETLTISARQLGIPRASLLAWRTDGRHPKAAENATQKKRALAEALEDVALKLLDVISPEMIARASLLDVMKAACIAIDKMLALQGATCSAGTRRAARRISFD